MFNSNISNSKLPKLYFRIEINAFYGLETATSNCLILRNELPSFNWNRQFPYGNSLIPGHTFFSKIFFSKIIFSNTRYGSYNASYPRKLYTIRIGRSRGTFWAIRFQNYFMNKRAAPQFPYDSLKIRIFKCCLLTDNI